MWRQLTQYQAIMQNRVHGFEHPILCNTLITRRLPPRGNMRFPDFALRAPLEMTWRVRNNHPQLFVLWHQNAQTVSALRQKYHTTLHQNGNSCILLGFFIPLCISQWDYPHEKDCHFNNLATFCRCIYSLGTEESAEYRPHLLCLLHPRRGPCGQGRL